MLTGVLDHKLVSVTAIDVATIPIKNDIRKEVIQNNKKQEIALYDEQ